jgi:RNA polymerase sigma-70 factor (ECF subfamily)
MGPDPDLELLEAWRGGDKKAADQILVKYYGLVRRAIVTKVPPDAVDDLVQEVIAALVVRRDVFRTDATFRTYVLAIARNVVCDYFRKRARRPVEHVTVFDSSVRDLSAGPTTLLLRHENQRLLLEALRNISMDDQFILELHYWEKMTGPQLAQVFEVGEPAIRGRLRRAKERLEAKLHELSHNHRELAATITDLDAWAQRLRNELQPYMHELKGRAGKK